MSGSKSSANGTPPRERKIRHALFLLFSQAVSFLFSSFHLLCSFIFLIKNYQEIKRGAELILLLRTGGHYIIISPLKLISQSRS